MVEFWGDVDMLWEDQCRDDLHDQIREDKLDGRTIDDCIEDYACSAMPKKEVMNVYNMDA